jgi:hypothetical protein
MGCSGGGADEEAPLPESPLSDLTIGSSGRSSTLMTSLGSDLAADEALGGTSTSGVTGIEAGDGLTLFLVILGAWFLELLL